MGGDWNENIRKVVDKHPSCIEVGECRPPHRGGKHTRHWCKGRVGIPHTWEWQRTRDNISLEDRFGVLNRVTEHPICFGCEKIDGRYRSYCRQCGEPWPELHHEGRGGTWRTLPCVRCGAEWLVRHRPGQWAAAGSVVR